MTLLNAGALVTNDHLPIEAIFNLLSICRRSGAVTSRTLRAALARRGLRLGSWKRLPRLSFWINLCRCASLLDEGFPLYPTPYVEDWLSFSLRNQIASLVEAWNSAPLSPELQSKRKRLPDRLLAGEKLSRKDRRELAGLQALGLCSDERLTPLGAALWTGQGHAMGERMPSPWDMQPDPDATGSYTIEITYPPEWRLLWDLETYIDPVEPGVYLITPETVRRAVQRQAYEKDPGFRLAAILERGLRASVPAELQHILERGPALRVLYGPVLEFSDPKELVRLRESRSWREELDDLLSPRHVRLDPWRAPQLLRRLQRQNWLDERDLEHLPVVHPVTAAQGAQQRSVSKGAFSRLERSYLLSLLLLAEGLQAPYSPPPGLFAKLAGGLDDRLRAAAARRATVALEKLAPEQTWVPEEEPPPAPDPDLSDAIQRAIDKGESLDVLYHAAGRPAPEYRHLTPLLLEARGPRQYLIAYCHFRRANRTFRLDRLKLIDFPP